LNRPVRAVEPRDRRGRRPYRAVKPPGKPRGRPPGAGGRRAPPDQAPDRVHVARDRRDGLPPRLD